MKITFLKRKFFSLPPLVNYMSPLHQSVEFSKPNRENFVVTLN